MNIDVIISSKNVSRKKLYSADLITLGDPISKEGKENGKEAADHVPTHLGSGALHMRRPPPKHTTFFAPWRR